MWGGKMMDAITDLVEIVALGLGLEKDALVDRIKYGPHLLAPTGSNFNVFNQLNDVLAAYHYGKAGEAELVRPSYSHLSFTRPESADDPRQVALPWAVHLASRWNAYGRQDS
jgi:hypothetical protein